VSLFTAAFRPVCLRVVRALTRGEDIIIFFICSGSIVSIVMFDVDKA
jgi:hypothetical protein